MNPRQHQHFVWASILFALLWLTPLSLRGHGELLIRIAAMTRQIEESNNPSAEAFLKRGELYRQDKNWEAAEVDYARAAELDPGLSAVDFCRALMLADSGQLEESCRRLSKVIQLSPGNGEAWIARARVRVKLEARQDAVNDYRQGLSLLDKPAPEYFVELATMLAAEGDPTQALRTLDAGIEKLGPLLALEVPALDLELSRADTATALRRLEIILAQAHRKESWLARRGDILLAAGRQAEARQSYEEALAAIKTLPALVQKGPSITTLQARVSSALAGMINAPIAHVRSRP